MPFFPPRVKKKFEFLGTFFSHAEKCGVVGLIVSFAVLGCAVIKIDYVFKYVVEYV